MSGTFRHLLLLALLGAFVGGCSSSARLEAWNSRWLEAERAHVHGEDAVALVHLEALDAAAESQRDRHEVLVRRGDCLTAIGRARSAMTSWFRSGRIAPDRNAAARSYLRVVRWMSVEPGMELKGLQGMIRLLDAFPDTRAGKRALDHVVAVFQGTAQGQRWLRAFLAGRWRMHRKTGLAKFIAYEQGRLFARSADRPDWERAVRTMADIERLFPRSALWDDAVYARSELLHRLGRYEEELDALRLILKHRRRGLFGDVAETAYYHRSQWRVAQVLQHDLREFELAELALKYFVREFAFSRRFDDALYELLDAGAVGTGVVVDVQLD